MDGVRYIVKLNDKTYFKGRGRYFEVDFIYKTATIDIGKATVFGDRTKAEDIVEEYGGEICEIGLREV